MKAGEDDVLTLVIDLTKDSLEPALARRDELAPAWETVGQLTGVGAEASRGRLAEALLCRDWEVRRHLEQRGDRWVMTRCRWTKKTSRNPGRVGKWSGEIA